MAILTCGTFARSRREGLQLSRDALALRAGVSVSTIARLELSNHLPGSKNLLRIADALGVSTSQLIDPERFVVSDSLVGGLQ